MDINKKIALSFLKNFGKKCIKVSIAGTLKKKLFEFFKYLSRIQIFLGKIKAHLDFQKIGLLHLP